MNKSFKYFTQVYIVLSIASFVTLFYFSTFAEFEKKDDFSRDIRVELPDYSIQKENLTSIYAPDGEFQYDSLAFQLLLSEPISDEMQKRISQERMGWKHVEGLIYKKNRGIISESLECSYELGSRTLHVCYCYGFDSFIIPFYFAILLAILVVLYIISILLIILIQVYSLRRSTFKKQNEDNVICPKSYLGYSLICLILFFPAGIVAIIASRSVYISFLRGQIDLANKYSKHAKSACVGTVVAAILFIAMCLYARLTS